MIFALTQNTIARLKRDSKSDALIEVHPREQIGVLPAATGQQQHRVVVNDDTKQTHSALDLYYVHIKKENRRDVLYFIHDVTGLSLAYQLGSLKLNRGLQSLKELLFELLQNMYFDKDALEAYRKASPFSVAVTTGTAGERAFMNNRIRQHYYFSESVPAGKNPLRKQNLLVNVADARLKREGIEWQRRSTEMFQGFVADLCGICPKQAIPAIKVTARLMGGAEADRAQYAEAPLQPMDLDPSNRPWRQFVLPQLMTVKELADLFQTVFNLLPYHLNAFHLRNRIDSRENEIHLIDEADPYLDELVYQDLTELRRIPQDKRPVTKYQEEVTCEVFLNEPRKHLLWNYDFGDNFWYSFKTELAVLDSFRCDYIGGANDPVPTDVGGYNGYDSFLKALANPNEKENSEILAWAVSVVDWRPYDEELMQKIFRNRYWYIIPSLDLYLSYWRCKASEGQVLKDLGMRPSVIEGLYNNDDDDDDFPFADLSNGDFFDGDDFFDADNFSNNERFWEDVTVIDRWRIDNTDCTLEKLDVYGDTAFLVFNDEGIVLHVLVHGLIYHPQNIFLALRLEMFLPEQARAIFAAIQQHCQKPLEVSISEKDTLANEFLLAGGFELKRLGFDMQVESSDLIHPVKEQLQLETVKRGDDLYLEAAQLSFESYKTFHAPVNPYTGTLEVFLNVLPDQALIHREKGKILHTAFFEKSFGPVAEIVFLAGVDPDTDEVFVDTLLAKIFKNYSFLFFTAEDASPIAMILKGKFSADPIDGIQCTYLLPIEE